MDACLLYVTTASRDDALALARTLVEEGLAACGNVIDGMVSVYRWQGELREDPEAVLILKTRPDLAETAIARLRGLHGYDCPCILQLPVDGGNSDFLSWIATETLGGRDGPTR
ncbi:divalent-cation tolerance protein CutA [Phaeospirillum tilakii]|uniref:Divalent-cation tolerance protein CutA n=1 Tax=Phaeospirillum tilakii TaxID=741673 RepID=A0ABW5CB74_9PROT